MADRSAQTWLSSGEITNILSDLIQLSTGYSPSSDLHVATKESSEAVFTDRYKGFDPTDGLLIKLADLSVPITDLDDIDHNSSYCFATAGTSNVPSGTGSRGVVVTKFYDANTYATQFVYGMDTGNHPMYYRIRIAGAWESWSHVADAAIAPFDNSYSGFAATTVQDAIDENVFDLRLQGLDDNGELADAATDYSITDLDDIADTGIHSFSTGAVSNTPTTVGTRVTVVSLVYHLGSANMTQIAFDMSSSDYGISMRHKITSSWGSWYQVNSAGACAYDNSTSGMTAMDVQAAIDEIEARLDAHSI